MMNSTVVNLFSLYTFITFLLKVFSICEFEYFDCCFNPLHCGLILYDCICIVCWLLDWGTLHNNRFVHCSGNLNNKHFCVTMQLEKLDGHIHGPTSMGIFRDFECLSVMTTRCFAVGVVLSRSQHDMCIRWLDFAYAMLSFTARWGVSMALVYEDGQLCNLGRYVAFLYWTIFYYELPIMDLSKIFCSRKAGE
jgi:hypothetical protein